MIEIEGLFKEYRVDVGPVSALTGIHFKLAAGQRLGLFGPSGSGKTTLLRCIAGLETPQRGLISIDGEEVFNSERGRNVPPWRRPIGMVFQDFALWPHLRVMENVLFPLRFGRTNTLTVAEQQRVAMDVLERVRLEEFVSRYPSELSGGQRQRVALARALVSRPKILLMDEPLSSLDPQLRKQTRNELIEILDASAITTIFVSHDHEDGLFMAHYVGIMRSGSIVQTEETEAIFQHPTDASVAETLDMGAIFDCEPDGRDGEFVIYRLRDQAQPLRFPWPARGTMPVGACVVLIPNWACSIDSESPSDAADRTLVGSVVGGGYTVRGWCLLVSICGKVIEVWQQNRPTIKRRESVRIRIDVQRLLVLPA